MTREEYNKSIEAQLKRVKETLIKKKQRIFNRQFTTSQLPPECENLTSITKRMCARLYGKTSDFNYRYAPK